MEDSLLPQQLQEVLFIFLLRYEKITRSEECQGSISPPQELLEPCEVENTEIKMFLNFKLHMIFSWQSFFFFLFLHFNSCFIHWSSVNFMDLTLTHWSSVKCMGHWLPGPSSYCSLHDKPISREMSCWGKEKWLYSESRQTKNMVDQCPKEPSHPVLNSGFFYTKRGRNIVGFCKLLAFRILCFCCCLHRSGCDVPINL